MRKSSIPFLLASLLLFTNCSTESTPIYTLSTNVNPSEAGSVTPASGEYDEGTTVEIIATPNEHWVFNGWQGDHTGIQNPVSIVMDSDKSITAQFIKREYPLTINVEGEGSVQEEVIQQKTTDYPHGTIVQLTANPAEGWEFIEWSGDVDGTEKVVEIEVDEEKSVTAHFQPIDFLLTIEVDGNGQVEEEIVQSKNTEYPFGTNVQLTAIPDEGWEFIEWSGDLEGDENPQTIIIQEQTNITAVFEQIEYTIDLNLDGNGEININPNKDFYVFGEEIIITVEPESGWNFVHWKGDVEGTDNPLQLIIDQSINATAVLDNSPFEGGNGSEEFPYMVSTVEQLQEVRNYPNRNFIQLNNIDASETKNWNGGEGFAPIGDDVIIFTGSYNGNNYTISNLFINRHERRVGLFGQTQSAKLESIQLQNVNIASTRGVSNSGGLVGNSGSNTKIYNCHVSGVLNGTLSLGGLVGANWGEISKSSSEIEINASNTVIGGLVGRNNGEINLSFAIGSVNSPRHQVGGLIGENRGSIYNSYSVVEVSGDEEVGGFIGVNMSSNQVIKNSFSAGAVSGGKDVGGFIGLNAISLEDNYCDSDASNQPNCIGRGVSDGISGLNTSQMKGAPAEQNMPEFDWETVWNITSGYPILRWQEE